MCRITTLVFSFMFLLLGACNNGSSFNGTEEPSNTATLATIDSANAESVAAKSMGASMQAGSFGSITDIVGLTAGTPGGVSKLAVSGARKSSITGIAVPVGPETTQCVVSGSVTLSGDIADPVTLTPNDFLNFDWDNCDDGLGIVTDGLIGLTITGFSGDLQSGELLLSTTLSVGNFRVTSGNSFESANGDISITVDTRTPPVSTAMTSGTLFAVSDNDGSTTLSSFSNSVTEDATVFPSTFVSTASGTVTSTEFSGAVNYATPVPFEALGDAYPHTGELLVTGANKATARLVAIDAINVRIEADYDGDNAVDQTIFTTWAALLD